ncbi:bifunctional folylpolyglutamate synthase/dihydrofolate synthase [Paenibacillus sp. TRM 82003]|uniref:bifunctional folylpolyglutamate synthase/dihydrofolate synthase n=1 Tax=Kineococcus sp. TRM81007 TaxID=2925831 RepID=UPI001F55C80A|nr:folylpolyglutamate synthase/dihydrofolate synthase family protein [Kineococcus sp. TRM81007]MCI2240045.1 bifunctional folylpolyglutamate synthase/dihydrofolate synthase [Kineococcus sp. TRM81007]MCI3925649.1 bifunctional folylpolyglutamate synthase/dihydrofolate synthase [Paenibacillus sp. TRM 82003]
MSSPHPRSERARTPVDDPRYAEVVAGILARNPEHRIHPTLDRVREACGLLGDPQRAYRVVHVAGTNGKTSTARMVERLVREHDLRTGRFTSPHLVDVTERISIDGEPISRAAFVRAWDDVEAVVDIVDARAAERGDPRLSFFEVLTLMAFAAFADAPVDVAVVETGLGGTWDTTNVVEPDVAVVTPVAMDHEAWLGSTLEEIAAQKAGIVKHGATFVVGRQEEEAAGVLLARAAAERVTVLREGADFGVESRSLAVGGQLLSLRTRGGLYTDVLLPLHGAHQASNAAVALAAAEALLALPGDTLVPGLVEAAFTDATSPGRLEVLRTSPLLVVDSAHNPAGARALAEAVAEAFTLTRLVGVVAIAGDKDVEGVLAALEPVLAEVVVTRTSSDRSLEPAELADIAEGVFGEDRVHVAERLDAALTTAVDLAESEGGPGAGVLVAGSVVLAGDARLLLARGGAR